MKELYKKESVWLSYILRHGAEKEGVPMDKAGWVKCDDLIDAAKKAGRQLDAQMIYNIWHTDNKQRYAFNNDTLSIRANQGHSLKVDVGLKKAVPPIELYHGTSMDVTLPIKKKGIQKMTRQYVHLSEQLQTAFEVGSRHGAPAVFTIDCKAMLADGIDFFKSENGVWLVDEVHPKYLKDVIYKNSLR